MLLRAVLRRENEMVMRAMSLRLNFGSGHTRWEDRQAGLPNMV